MSADSLLIAWGAWARVHHEALGWSKMDVLADPESVVDRRLARNPGEHSNPVLSEVLIRDRSGDQIEQISDWAVRKIEGTGRDPVILKYLWEMGPAEIGKKQGVTVNCVEKRIERGRTAFMANFIWRRKQFDMLNDRRSAERRRKRQKTLIATFATVAAGKG